MNRETRFGGFRAAKNKIYTQSRGSLMHNKFAYGVDYYPEQWDETRWEIDASLMREAGFNTVRLAEFAWAKLEPTCGVYDFAWLDRAITVLANHGLEVVLGTPTASPPAWLYAANPEIFRVLPDGRRLTYGHRRGYSPSHPEYLEHTRRIVRAMAQHYANHPAVIGWQIDNEFGDRDYSPAAQTAFQHWLKQKYFTLEALNTAWGTVFWSHTYSDWSQIPVPLQTGATHNPALCLEFARFSSDSYVTYQSLQLEILRQYCPNHFMTHNLMGFGYDQINYYDLANKLDLVTWDNYPRMWWNISEGDEPARAALGHATMRGLKNQAFWVMEQQSGAGGWEYVVPHPKPGEIRLWAMQAIAHGANGIIFFRFRTARHGAEQYWHGLLEHDGTPGRRYQEVKALGAELQTLGSKILKTRPKAEVAFVLSYDSRFAFQIQQNNPNLHYTQFFKQLYSSFHAQNIGVDVVSPTADLQQYKLVIVPLLHVVTPEIAANLERYVLAGGTLLLSFRSGVKDEHNAVVNAPLPGLLRSLVGAKVSEYDSLYGSTPSQVQLSLPARETQLFPSEIWCDVLEPEAAQVLARYTTGHYAGSAAITRNSLGLGEVILLGTAGKDLESEVLSWLAERLELRSRVAAPEGVEIVERCTNDERFLFILNHTPEPQSVQVPSETSSDLDNKLENEFVTIEPFGVLILNFKTTLINTRLAHATEAIWETQ
jgi:beta-galactosidase